MGVHSTLFGPVKYGILPQHLQATTSSSAATALVEMGTFVAILLGTIAGGVLVQVPAVGPDVRRRRCLAVAVAGLASQPLHPARARAATRRSRINWNPFTRDLAQPATSPRANRAVFLRCSASRGSGSSARSSSPRCPRFARDVLGGDEHVVTLLLARVLVGIGLGSLLCERLSGRKVEIGLVPFGSIGMTLFAVDLWFASRARTPARLSSVARVPAQPRRWRILVDLSCSRCSAASTSCRSTR